MLLIGPRNLLFGCHSERSEESLFRSPFPGPMLSIDPRNGSATRWPASR